MGVLLVHGAGYDRDPALRYLKRQRLQSGLMAGFVAAGHVSFTDALHESLDAVPFAVRMVEYSHALNDETSNPSTPPADPTSLVTTHNWEPIAAVRCMCCRSAKNPTKRNVRTWVGKAAKGGPPGTDGMIERRFPDVDRYLRRGDGRAVAISTVLAGLAPDVRVIVGHSLGSVVVVDALARAAQDAVPDLLVTIGSPLRHDVIRRQLDAATTNWIERRPTPWLNVYDRSDIVTGGGSLRSGHFPGVINVAVDNRSHSHAGDYYLRHRVVGHLIWDVATGVLDPQRLRSGIPRDDVYGSYVKDR